MRSICTLFLLIILATSTAAANEFIGRWRKVDGDGNISRISIFTKNRSLNVVAHFGKRGFAFTKVQTFNSDDNSEYDLIIARKDTKLPKKHILGDAPLGTTYNYLILEMTPTGRLSAHFCKRTPLRSIHYKALYEKGKQVTRRKIRPGRGKR